MSRRVNRSEHILSKMRANKILLSSIGCGQVFCGLVSMIIGIWSFYKTTHEFKDTYGSHIWAGADYLFCGLMCLLATTSKQKTVILLTIITNLVSMAMSLTIAILAFMKCVKSTSFRSNNSTVFNVSLLSISSMALMFFGGGLRFSLIKYDQNYRQPLSGADAEGTFQRRTTTVHDDSYWGYRHNIFSFTNESFIVPPPLDGAPPPYSEYPIQFSTAEYSVSVSQTPASNEDGTNEPAVIPCDVVGRNVEAVNTGLHQTVQRDNTVTTVHVEPCSSRSETEVVLPMGSYVVQHQPVSV